MKPFPRSPLGFVLHFVRQQKWKFIFLTTGAVFWAINDVFFPYFLKQIVNKLQHFNGTAVFSAVRSTLILLMVFWLVMEFLQRSQGVLQIYTFPKFRAQIREAVFNYVKCHSHEYFISKFSGNIAKKLGDLPTSSQSIIEILSLQMVTTVVGSVVVVGMMWSVHAIFAVITLVWLCIHFGLTFLFLRYGHDLWTTHSDAVSALNGKIVDVFTNMLNVRLFARGDYESRYLKRYQQDEIKKSKKALWSLELTRMGLGLNGLFLIFGVLATLMYGWAHHWVTLGDFTQVAMQAFWVLGWIWFISYQITVLTRELGTISDALNLVRVAHDVVDEPKATTLQVNRGEIVFDRVNFAYRKGARVFNDLNVTILPGQKVGLVGFSGSGKSTFVNLILRFYDLNSGQILIDSQNIAAVTQDSLHENIGMIPQDPALFHRTLMENIRYGNLEASDEAVIRASKLAHCDEFINQLDEGYQSLVGERGVKLSGGQRQRVAIARAILKDAPILILDEATSSLDSVTEKLIQSSLQELMQNRTTIVIAHRLSTLANMDRILVFHQGQIVEEGTQESLLRQNGHFAMLWNMQADGFLPEKEQP